MRRLIELAEVDSTNNWLKSQKAYLSFMSVRALRQTAGRGRNERAWHGTESDLAFSMLLPYPAQRATLLPAHVALVVQRALHRYAGVAIKWPNDIVHESKKLAGILCENFPAEKNLFIAGIGVNVGRKEFPAELADRATSLALMGCQNVTARTLWFGLVRALWKEFKTPAPLPLVIHEYNRVAVRYQKRRDYPGEVLEFCTLLEDGRAEFLCNGERILLSAAD